MLGDQAKGAWCHLIHGVKETLYVPKNVYSGVYLLIYYLIL